MLYDELVQPGDYICHYGVKGMEWGKVKKEPYQSQKPNSGNGKTVSNVQAPNRQPEKVAVSRPKHPQQSGASSQPGKNTSTKPQGPQTPRLTNKVGNAITNHGQLPTGVASRNSEEALRVEQNAAVQLRNRRQQQNRNRRRREAQLRRIQRLLDEPYSNAEENNIEAWDVIRTILNGSSIPGLGSTLERNAEIVEYQVNNNLRSTNTSRREGSYRTGSNRDFNIPEPQSTAPRYKTPEDDPNRSRRYGGSRR